MGNCRVKPGRQVVISSPARSAWQRRVTGFDLLNVRTIGSPCRGVGAALSPRGWGLIFETVSRRWGSCRRCKHSRAASISVQDRSRQVM
jgi:hypothetical protein